MNLKKISVVTTLGLCIAIAGCNSDEATEASPKAVSSEQGFIQKYNAYVEVANNLHTPFYRELSDYQTVYEPAVQAGKKLDSYSVVSLVSIKNTQEKLKSALALEADMPEIDGPAKQFDDSLSKLAPLNAELNNYAESKEFLTDGGKKAADNNEAFVSALTQVVQAEAAFLQGIQKQDEINIQTSFDKAPKDSVEHYRLGVVLFSKQAMNKVDAIFEQQGAKESIPPFQESLDQAAAMISNWDKKFKEETPQGCPRIMSKMNEFLAQGRSVTQHASEGNYVPQQGSISWQINNPIKNDASSLQLKFNAMIGSLNYPRC